MKVKEKLLIGFKTAMGSFVILKDGKYFMCYSLKSMEILIVSSISHLNESVMKIFPPSSSNSRIIILVRSDGLLAPWEFITEEVEVELRFDWQL